MLMTASQFTIAQRARIAETYSAVLHQSLTQRLRPWLITAAILGYFVFCWVFFDLGKILGQGNWERGGIELSEWVTWQSRPSLEFKNGALKTVWSSRDPLGKSPNPEWLQQTTDGSIQVTYGNDTYRLVVSPERVIAEHAGERIVFERGAKGWVPAAEALPDWAEAQTGRTEVAFGFAGSAEIYGDRITVRRRFFGWPNFVFDPDSQFWGKPVTELAGLAFTAERIKPEQSNLAAMWNDIWNNSLWQHGDVWVKLLQTIIMAFVGTLFAAVISFPLAFLAARSVTNSIWVNQFVMRFFDFMRCVDMFVWALFFTRGFGPGPLAGIAAIFFTDIGTLGKTNTEALDNIDGKQREGIRSVGASPIQVQRYGVVPQVLPVIASQALYQWESNTRSATIIGAMGAGGIGLKLLEAMRTGTNWANVAYMVTLILIVVYVFDGFSGWLRRKLIVG
jgi:phosphonate transport system permease protein